MKDLREHGQIILAHGEVTGHRHEIVTADDVPPVLEGAQFFEEPDGRRVLLVVGETPVYLRHEEHGRLRLDPTRPEQLRQGDVLLNPIGPGAWEVIRQREEDENGWRSVAD